MTGRGPVSSTTDEAHIRRPGTRAQRTPFRFRCGSHSRHARQQSQPELDLGTIKSRAQAAGVGDSSCRCPLWTGGCPPPLPWLRRTSSIVTSERLGKRPIGSLDEQPSHTRTSPSTETSHCLREIVTIVTNPICPFNPPFGGFERYGYVGQRVTFNGSMPSECHRSMPPLLLPDMATPELPGGDRPGVCKSSGLWQDSRCWLNDAAPWSHLQSQTACATKQ